MWEDVCSYANKAELMLYEVTTCAGAAAEQRAACQDGNHSALAWLMLVVTAECLCPDRTLLHASPTDSSEAFYPHAPPTSAIGGAWRPACITMLLVLRLRTTRAEVFEEGRRDGDHPDSDPGHRRRRALAIGGASAVGGPHLG